MERGAFKSLLNRIDEAEEGVDQWGNPLSYGGNSPPPRVKASDLVTVTSKQGFSVKVHKTVAPQFQELINYMDEPGANGKPRYEIKYMDGYYNKWIMRNDPETGKRVPLVRNGKYVPSNHGLGASVDFNPDDNPESFKGKVKTNIPPDVIDKANELGIGNGANWQRNHKDPMHFSAIGKEGGKMAWNPKTRDFDLDPVAVANRDEKIQKQAGPNLTDKQLAAMKKEIEKEMSTVSAQAPTVTPSSADTDRIKKLAGISDEQVKLDQLLQANPGMKMSNVIYPGSIINLPDGSKYKIGKGDNLTRISQGKYKGEIVTPVPAAAPATAATTALGTKDASREPAIAAPAATTGAEKAAAPVVTVPAADLRQAAGTVTAPYEPKIDKLDPMGRPYPPNANDYQRSVIDALASKGIATNDPNLIATEPSPSIQQPSVPEPVPYDVLRKQFEKEKIQGAGGGVVANPDVIGTYDPSKYAQPQSVIDKVTGSDAYKGVVDAIKTAAGSTPVKSFKDYIGNIMQSPGPFGNLKVNPQDTTGNEADYEFLKSQGVDAFKPEVPAKESVQKTNEYGNTDPAKDFTNTSASKVMYPPTQGPDEIGDLIKQLDKIGTTSFDKEIDKMSAPVGTDVFDPKTTGPAQKFDPNAKIPQPGQFLKQDDAEARKSITEKELIVKDEGEIEADSDEEIETVDKPAIRTKDRMHNEADISESLFKDSLNLIKKFAGI